MEEIERMRGIAEENVLDEDSLVLTQTKLHALMMTTVNQ